MFLARVVAIWSIIEAVSRVTLVGSSIRWGSSGFAEQRNLKKICCGIRNSSNFSAERRNSPLLRDADFLKNYKGNAEFS